MRAESLRAGVPLRKSLLARLLGASLLIAVCAIAATAWLAVQTTTGAIRQEQGQILTDDANIYKTLVDYAADHTQWDGAGQTVLKLARQTHRRITLTTQDNSRRTIIDSAPGASSLPTNPLAVIDPLQVDPALVPDASADRIDPRAVGPLQLSTTEQHALQRTAQTEVGCLAQMGINAKISSLPSGRTQVKITWNTDLELQWKIGQECNLPELDTPTLTEQAALTHLDMLVNTCLARQSLPAVQIGLDLAPTRPPGTDSVTSQTVQNCIDSGRREQLAAFVAPAAQLFVSEPAGSALTPGFTLSRTNVTRILGVTVLVLALTAAMTIAIGNRLVRPLRALADAARQPHWPNLHLPVTSRDEIGHLTEAFNDLSEHRAHTEAQRKVMVSDIAHELRTPLSTIRSWLEATQDGLLTTDDEVTSSLLEETLLLQHIVDDLQDLAAADSGALHLHLDFVDAGAVLQQVATAHGGHAQQAGITLDVRSEDEPWLFADPLRLRQAVSNLVSNAIRHTPPGGRVSLRSHRTADATLIEVSDTGTGISPEHLPHVFDRFWRAEKSRSRRTGGSGLGLAIVRQLVEAHGGTVAVASTPGTETVFTVRLPV